MAAFPKNLLTLLLLLAMSSAQVLGIGRGYLCHCGEQPVLSASADCDTGGCHDDDTLPHHSDEEHGHEHEKVSEPLEGLTFVPLAPAPPVLREWLLPEWLQPAPLKAACDACFGDTRPPPDPRASAAIAVRVAKTAVRLV